MDAIQLVREHEPDVVILDIGIPKLDGLTVISRIKSLELRTQVLVLTSQSAEAFCKRCIQVGARGFVNKEEDLNNLINALNAVIAGYTFFPSLTFDTLGTPPERISESELIGLLSDREMIVLQHLAMGYSNKAIGEKLFLSNKTVSTYKTRLLQKLGLGSLVDLAEFAKRNSLIH